jgi:hypothetical protein
MTLENALIIFMTKIMGPQTYNDQVLKETAHAISAVTNDFQEAETMARIARYESGGFRSDIANCKTRGDHGAAFGIFQVHPFTDDEAKKVCSSDLKEQAIVSLNRVRGSFERCARRGLGGSDKLTEYTHGHCHRAKGADDAARLRYGDGKAVEKLVYTEINVPIRKRAVN